MRKKGLLKKILTVICFLWLTGAFEVIPQTGFTVLAAEKKEEESNAVQNQLLQEIDLSKVQKLIDQLLGKDSFSFREALEKLLKGEEPVTKETVLQFVRSLFFRDFPGKKPFL